MNAPSGAQHGLRTLNQHFIKTLKALHAAGEGERACRLAADAWSALRAFHPEEAERLSAALHFLVRPVSSQKEKDHVQCPTT